MICGATKPLDTSKDARVRPVVPDSSRSAAGSASGSWPAETRACARRRDHSTLVAAEGLIFSPVSLRASCDHPQNFLEGRLALERLSQSGLAQGHHALLYCQLVDVVGAPTLDDQALDLFGNYEQLEERL